MKKQNLLFTYLTCTWLDQDSVSVKIKKSSMLAFSLLLILGGVVWSVALLVSTQVIPSLIPLAFALSILFSTATIVNEPRWFSSVSLFQLLVSFSLPLLMPLLST